MLNFKIKKSFTGLHGSANAWQIAKLAKSKRLLVVVNEHKDLEQLAEDLPFFGVKKICLFPHWDCLPLEHVSPQVEITAQRLATLSKISNADFEVCICTTQSLIQRILTKEDLNFTKFKLVLKDKINREEVVQNLVAAGFELKELVEHVGQFSIRGYVIDLFPAGSTNPIRLEIKSDVLQSIKRFNSESQRTFEPLLNEIEIIPVRELLPLQKTLTAFKPQELKDYLRQFAKTAELNLSEADKFYEAYLNQIQIPGIELINFLINPKLPGLIDYLPNNTNILLIDPIDIDQALDQLWENSCNKYQQQISQMHLTPEANYFFINPLNLLADINKFEIFGIERIELLESNYQYLNLKTELNIELLTSQNTKTLKASTSKIINTIKDLYHAKWKLIFIIANDTRIERLQKLLQDQNLASLYFDHTFSNWYEQKNIPAITIIKGHINQGFKITSKKIALISEYEIFNSKTKNKTQKVSTNIRRLMGEIARLAIGDYVVHQDYGIGIYNGLKNITLEEIKGDFLDLQYADSKLYLPLQNIKRIQKYHTNENHAPALDRLSSQRWKQTKAKVKTAIISLAGELIKLYARRQVQRGWRFEPYGASDEIFAEDFPYTETVDQAKAIQETLSDMAKDRPMDRLVCGDVGFGKTEVAIRAAFKASQHAKQVAVLVPTTLLVDQHLKSFQTRFRDHSININGLSRFFKPKDNKKTLHDLAYGTLDIVIGTHRLLSRDVKFKDLGLLIIDEEHRFGVKQKERLKALRSNVDVLSLTATPIPRTLHMSLSEIRDISVIATPPVDRQVIKTYIAEKNDGMIRDSILRELQRNGQVFYLHNRVENIAIVCKSLSELVPEARIKFAHGKMTEVELEKIMYEFSNHQFDVLVTTTIIESGIDIPNANTLIVERADTFGLAQLYQIRGRVGRSSRQSYAYLMINDLKKLSGTAKRRLEVLQNLDSLGQGFSLALQDLEIRGAGNLLGQEQSGYVNTLGYELYSKILQEAVLNLRGEELEIEELVDPEVKIKIPAYIPENYIPDISQRLVLYQRLASAKNSNEISELKDEILDRFGPLDLECDNLIELMRVRTVLKHLGVDRAEVSENKLGLFFNINAKIEPKQLNELQQRYKCKIRPNNLLIFELRSCNTNNIAGIYNFIAQLIDDLHLS